MSCVGARAPGPLESLKIPSGIKRAAGGGSWPWGKYTHETKIVGPEAGYSMTQKKGYSPFASPQASLPAKRRSSASDPLWRQRLWKLPARALCSPPHGPHQDFGAKPMPRAPGVRHYWHWYCRARGKRRPRTCSASRLPYSAASEPPPPCKWRNGWLSDTHRRYIWW